MPITDRTSKALLNFSGGQDGHLTPTFPSFLPLETFDNTEFDCRTPEEWLQLGEEESAWSRWRSGLAGREVKFPSAIQYHTYFRILKTS